jgi:hypothetical protein
MGRGKKRTANSIEFQSPSTGTVASRHSSAVCVVYVYI